MWVWVPSAAVLVLHAARWLLHAGAAAPAAGWLQCAAHPPCRQAAGVGANVVLHPTTHPVLLPADLLAAALQAS